ncbi:MAG: PilZ domain-containing protein [Desulfocapsaceae bacterium]|nr:PilZ domain-containing protein [Desulfocapsaceae bacterium]
MQQSSSRVSKLNRRKYNRFPSGHQLTLQQVTGANSRRQASLKTVYTTNESAGGLQIRTQSPLFNGSLVSFSYKSSAGSAQQKKLARVMWCRYQKDTLVYLAGLSFQKDGKSDDTSSKTG